MFLVADRPRLHVVPDRPFSLLDSRRETVRRIRTDSISSQRSCVGAMKAYELQLLVSRSCVQRTPFGEQTGLR